MNCMKLVLLTGQRFSRVQAGVEHFSSQLQQAFPDLQILAFDDLHQKTVPFLPEPFKAKAVCQALEKKINALKPDAVLYNNLYGWALPKKTRYAKIGIAHGTYSSFAKAALPISLNRLRLEYVYSWFEKKSLENADLVISNSRFTRRLLQNDYGLDSKTIGMGVDTSVFFPENKQIARKKLGLPSDRPVILFVGRPDYSKGFDLFEKISQQQKDWHCLSVTFPKASSSTVDCRKPVPPHELRSFYAASDCVVFPSRFEGFGFITVEALACHRPIVTTAYGIATEIRHNACQIAKQATADAFIPLIQHAITNPFGAVPDFEKQFGIKTAMNRYQTLIKQAISAKKP